MTDDEMLREVEMKITRSLTTVPSKPELYRMVLRRVAVKNGLERTAKMLSKTVDELLEELGPDTTERIEKDRIRYRNGLRKCVQDNLEWWTIEEIARTLRIDVKELIIIAQERPE